VSHARASKQSKHERERYQAYFLMLMSSSPPYAPQLIPFIVIPGEITLDHDSSDYNFVRARRLHNIDLAKESDLTFPWCHTAQLPLYSK